MKNENLDCYFCHKKGKKKESLFNKNNLILFDGSLAHKECINQVLEKIDKYLNENIEKIHISIKGQIFKEEIIFAIRSIGLSNFIIQEFNVTTMLWNDSLAKKLDSEFSFRKTNRLKISLSLDNLTDYFSKKINIIISSSS